MAAPTYSRHTGHWDDCATYETLDASDCTCWERPHVTYMTRWGFHCETEGQGYCNWEPLEDDD